MAQCKCENQSLDLQYSNKHNPSTQVMEMGWGSPDQAGKQEWLYQ